MQATMQASVKNDLQTPARVLPDSKAGRPHSQHESAPGAEKANKPGGKNIVLPEDVVTLSDSGKPGTKAKPAEKKVSLPVTNAEKQALLLPVPSRYNFSVYG